MSDKDKTEELEDITPETEETMEEQTTAEEIVEEEDELTIEEKLQEELGKEKDKFLRLFAEFENYKNST